MSFYIINKINGIISQNINILGDKVPHQLDLLNPREYDLVKDQLTLDAATFSLDTGPDLNTIHLCSRFPERKYRTLFARPDKGEALRQRFHYIRRLRRGKPESYNAEIQKVLTKMKMKMPSLPNGFGLGNGSEAPSLASPDPSSRKKAKLDTPKKDALMSPVPAAASLVSPVPAVTQGKKKKVNPSHYPFFKHLSFEELKESCK